jgi:hypothetical protein
VKGEVIAKDVEEVTFKFFIDGKEIEAKTVPMTDGVKDAQTGNVIVTHSFKAPDVADDKEKYVLDYHVFYKVKHKDRSSESHENLAVKSFEVLPRTAKNKSNNAENGKGIEGALGPGGAPLEGGAVVFTQWFGSMLQLTPHLHVLLPDAQWRTTSPPPTGVARRPRSRSRRTALHAPTACRHPRAR